MLGDNSPLKQAFRQHPREPAPIKRAEIHRTKDPNLSREKHYNIIKFWAILLQTVFKTIKKAIIASFDQAKADLVYP